MSDPRVQKLKEIRDLSGLTAFLRDELEWPIADWDVEDLTYDYKPEEVGLDEAAAVKVKSIRRLRPIVTGQPWGIFFLEFHTGDLPVTVLRRILRALVLRKRAAGRPDRQAWQMDDLLFISALGPEEGRSVNLAHFTKDGLTDQGLLRVVDWDEADTHFHMIRTDAELDRLRWREAGESTDGWRDRWRSAFTVRPRQVGQDARKLAAAMAELAKRIRDKVVEAYAIEAKDGALHGLFDAFSKTLIHDAKLSDFADMYAQTITYGLFAAKKSRPMGITAENAKDMVEHTNPFLADLLAQFTQVSGRNLHLDFDEFGVDALVQLLNDTNLDVILADWGRAKPGEDPVVHFYEDFLKAYDPRQKVKRGVFYTPQPVVSFIVRSVHELLQTEFRLPDGLASTETWGDMRRRFPDLKLPEGVAPDTPFVQVLDPAVGTGTFLVEVIQVIHDTMKKKWEAQGVKHGSFEWQTAWNEYVPRHLLTRLYGFELMMAPYTICHMKIGLKLAETGYRFGAAERVRVYLTNTLDPPQDFSGQFDIMAPAWAHEARAVNEVKRHTPFTVIIGNPPYSNYSANMAPEARELISEYRLFDGRRIRERNQLQFERNLNDDYVKFLAWSEQSVVRLNLGIVGLITNAFALSSRSLRGARQHWAGAFNDIFALHLHGGTAELLSDEDENVFDIEQPVAIHIWRRFPKRRGLCTVRFGQIVGSRRRKYVVLESGSVDLMSTEDVEYSLSQTWSFLPGDDAELDVSLSLPAVFEQFGAGIKTNQDGRVIDFTREALLAKVSSDFGPVDADDIRTVLYRPFDVRWLLYRDDAVASRSWPTMQHMIAGPNLCLIASSTWTTPGFFSVGVSTGIVEMKAGTHDRGTTVFPAYRCDRLLGGPPECVSNLAVAFQAAWPDAVENPHDEEFPVRAICWMYGCFHAPSFRKRYRATLATGFPFVPLPADAELYREIVGLGAEMISLHTERDADSILARAGLARAWRSLLQPDFVGLGDHIVSTGHPKRVGSGLHINEHEFFTPVPLEDWEFHIGGYQVCHKWLKDRRGRALTPDDIEHYRRIIGAITETIRIQKEIDEVIEAHGGWPAAFAVSQEGGS